MESQVQLYTIPSASVRASEMKLSRVAPPKFHQHLMAIKVSCYPFESHKISKHRMTKDANMINRRERYSVASGRTSISDSPAAPFRR